MLLSADRRSLRSFLLSPDFETEVVMLYRVIARELFFLVGRLLSILIW